MTDISRRQFISFASVATVGLVGLSRSARALGSNARCSRREEYIVIDTPHGKLRGINEDGVCIFRGIPYAGTVSTRHLSKAVPAFT